MIFQVECILLRSREDNDKVNSPLEDVSLSVFIRTFAVPC